MLNRLHFRPWHFFASICAVFCFASALGLHGSSIDAFAHYFPRSAETGPLLGTWKGIRVDEWNVHTPSILNQLFRPDTLSAEGSAVGPGASALLFNLPGKFLDMVFRPQFWSFFALPAESAFSIYWQFKTLLLLGGLFALLYFVTEHAAISAALALAFYFAAYTQWTFSWPTLLPEQIGSLCLAVTLFCRSLISNSRLKILGTAALAGMFAANFALSVYPPHQIPLAWVGGAIIVWWIVTRREDIQSGSLLEFRLAGVALASLVIGVALTSLYLDARDPILVGMNTVYPGQRRLEGGSQSVLLYASHFLDFWKTEVNTSKLLNVCEATGYLWFGPLTILIARRMEHGPLRQLYFTLFWLFVVFSAWIFLPLSIGFGRLMALDIVGTARMLPAMGLLNVLLLACFLTAYRPAPFSRRAMVVTAVVVAVLCGALFEYVNQRFDLELRIRHIAASALFVAACTILIRTHQRTALSIALVLPIALTTALVNPIGRGLPVIMKSNMHAFLASRPDLLRKRWLVFSEDVIGPDYLSAHGLDVFNSFHAIPDLAKLRLLDPEGRFPQIYNSSGYLIANAQSRNDIAFEPVSAGILRMMVTPADPRLRTIGVSALAFRQKPPAALVTGLRPLSDGPVDTFWLYEISP